MLDEVRHYYGRVLRTSADLQTSACCTAAEPPEHVRAVLGEIADEVTARYYGCGLVAPEQLEGLRVLDLGCGAGRDVFALSRLVGERGFVLGVDMTPEQLEVAERHIAPHMARFGYRTPNVAFRQGYIEDLGALALEAGSFDLVVSNCVVNLSPSKPDVLREAFRVLKPGGEMYFSDVYADRRVPAAVASHPLAYAECLGGALYWNDLHRIARAAGFADPRLVADRPITVTNPDLAAIAGNIRFFSATYRLFRLTGLESACEDYGQAVRYRGTSAHLPDAFVLDRHHRFETGRIVPVCGNTYSMLRDTRFAPHFDFFGDRSRHFGIFEGCGTSLPFATEAAAASAGCC
jgi:SAM-dependent methyltransferase